MLQRTVNIMVVFLSLAVLAVFIGRYGNSKITFYGDALGYYLYLPATCIHHNIRTPYEVAPDHLPPAVSGSFAGMKNEVNARGWYLDQYTYGVALMEAPFFLIAHGYEEVKGLPANGYTDTYSYLIKISSIFYSLLGCLLVYLILRRYFNVTLSL